jgi:hypothetical protein
MKKSIVSSLSLIFAMSAPAIAATSLENFESYSPGNTLTLPLNGGTGWNGAWVTANTTTASGVVSTTTPLNGNNQYLDTDLTNTAAGAAMGLGRGLEGGAPTDDFTVSFQWRPDNLTGWGGSANDRFEFYSSASAATVNSAGTGGNATTSPYLLGVFGAARGANYTATSAAGQLFGVYNPVNTNDAFSGDRYFELGSVATGGDGTTLAMVAGTTYSFTIEVLSDSQTWNLSVTDGVTTASSTGLKWWGTNTQPFVAFGARGSAANETRSFSIDNVSVVPEPSGVALFTLGGVALLTRRRRR